MSQFGTCSRGPTGCVDFRPAGCRRSALLSCHSGLVRHRLEHRWPWQEGLADGRGGPQDHRLVHDYREAERAVDHLSDPGFPVQRPAIRQDVRLVEQMTGRMGHGGAALHGAASGAPIGGSPGCSTGWTCSCRDCYSPCTGWFSEHSSALCPACW
ncbi:general stress protein [Streptomyces sp. NBC_00554]|uniref:general stress protein n=1 Tax=Streptomyces sp. NBC_00554 TaxID=2903661 RepID=UPI00352CD7DE